MLDRVAMIVAVAVRHRQAIVEEAEVELAFLQHAADRAVVVGRHGIVARFRMTPGTDEIRAVLRLQETDHDHLAHSVAPSREARDHRAESAVRASLPRTVLCERRHSCSPWSTLPNGTAPVELREVPEPQTRTQRGARRGARLLAQPRRTAIVPQQRGRLGAGTGCRRRRAAPGRGWQRPAGGNARRRADGRIRLGAARRGAQPSHGGVARQCQLLAGGDAAGRRPDRASHIASWRTAARQARADHRCRRRRRHHRRAACGAFWRARHGGGRTAGSRRGNAGNSVRRKWSRASTTHRAASG